MAVRERDHLFQTLLESMPGIVFRKFIREQYRMVFFNNMLQPLTGYDRGDLEKEDNPSIHHLILPEDRREMFDVMKEALSANNPYRVEYRIRKKDGEIGFFLECGRPGVGEDGKPLYIDGLILDISERKREQNRLLEYQKHLRSLASELLFSEERERRRIAIDIHDFLAQDLAISKLKLESVPREALPQEHSQKISEACALIEESLRKTRALVFSLSPPQLHDLGFEAALEALSETMECQHGIKFRVENDSRPKPLPKDHGILIFRIVRELLINVVKHAQAKSATISVRRENDYVRIRVEDDGIGYQGLMIDDTVRTDEKFGLFSIRERLDHIGGSFEIGRGPGGGATAELVLPLKKHL